MPESPETLPPLAAPTALAAFLRGVERRGAVLAELQAGEAGLGDAALARAMADFRGRALECPMADWPRLFWSELVRQPGLRRAGKVRVPDELPAASFAPGVRSVLLLRLVAGLDEAAAAQVLGVAPASVRRAIDRLVPRDAQGEADAAAWVRLRQALQQRVRELPTDRALRLSRGREAALVGAAEDFFPPPRIRLWPRVAMAVVLVALALGATWWFDRQAREGVDLVELRPAGRPASRYSATAGLVAHPDFAALADPEAERIARDVAFLSWSAAQVDASAPVLDPLASPPPSPAMPYTETETDDEP